VLCSAKPGFCLLSRRRITRIANYSETNICTIYEIEEHERQPFIVDKVKEQ